MIDCLSFFGLSVHGDLGIFATLSMPSGASPKVRAYAASSATIYAISITSSDVTIMSVQKFITDIISGSINALHRSNRALLSISGVYSTF